MKPLNKFNLPDFYNHCSKARDKFTERPILERHPSGEYYDKSTGTRYRDVTDKIEHNLFWTFLDSENRLLEIDKEDFTRLREDGCPVVLVKEKESRVPESSKSLMSVYNESKDCRWLADS